MPLPFVGLGLGSPFIELHSVDSTNNYALAQIRANLAHPGTCFFAHEQTAGKGQRGKTWATEKGRNIILSIVLKPAFLQLFQQFHLSACVAVATQDFLTRQAGEEIKLKWPNDVYWKDKKIGGILIENIARKSQNGQGSWEWAVVGIGINVNQTEFPANLKNPASLKQITGKNFDTIQLAKELCASIDFFYNKLIAEGIPAILSRYNEYLYRKNEIVKFKMLNRNFKVTVDRVNEMGQLIVHHGIEERLDFGKVEWVN